MTKRQDNTKTMSAEKRIEEICKIIALTILKNKSAE